MPLRIFFRRFLFWSFIALLNLSGIIQWYHCSYSIVDQAETLYHLKELSVGRIPYREIYTHHFLGYELPFYLINQLVVQIGPFEMWVLSFLFNLLNCLLVYRILKDQFQSNKAWIAALAQASLGWFIAWGGFSFNIQSYFTPFLYLYIWFILKAYNQSSTRDLMYAALVAGFLFICDQRLLAFSILLFIPLFSLQQQKLIQTSACALVAFALFPMLSLVFLWYYDALSDFWFATFTFPLRYRNFGLNDSRPERLMLLLKNAFSAEYFTVMIAFVSLLLCLIREKKRGIKLLIILYLAAAFAYVCAGGRVYPHYCLVLSPIIIILIARFEHYCLTGKNGASIAAQGTVLFICAFYASTPLIVYFNDGYLFFKQHSQTVQQTGAYIREKSAKSDTLFVWGYAPQIYLLAEKLSPFRDVGLISVAGANYASPLRSLQGISPQMELEFKMYLTSAPPTYFVFYEVLESVRNQNDSKPFTLRPNGPIAKNFDFRVVPELKYIKDLLHADYEQVYVSEDLFDRAEVYQRKPLSEFP